MREIVLDTETTGFDPQTGHRVVEIGCVELINHMPTGRILQLYLNPERDMPAEAMAVHGLTNEFLEKQPVFAEVIDQFLGFVENTPFVIHNASFDMNFLNAELTRLGFPPWPLSRATDTVLMARKMFPGAPASLDALCKRFGIDASSREYHGALLDARLLADVYLELLGGRQPDLALKEESKYSLAQSSGGGEVPRTFRAPRGHTPSDEERIMHETFLTQIKEPLWKRV